MKNEYYFLYETTNIVNNMIYVGIDKTTNINDDYIGSGVVLTNAIKKYGKEKFKRKILNFCESYDELLKLEKEIVNEKWVKDRTNYNVKTGGQSSGVLSEESKNKISNTLKEKYKNGEITSSIGSWVKENGNWLSNGGQVSDETKEKCSKSAKKRYEEDKKHPLKKFRNTIVSDTQKQKISKTLKEKYKNGERLAKHEPISEEHKNKISKTLKEKYKKQQHHSKGKTAWNKGKKLKKIECPYCGKMSDKSNAKRWHFDNCKLSPLYEKLEYKPMSEECKNNISKALKEKYKTQEHNRKGKPSWNKGKKMKKIECPHCGKFIDKLNARNWHFDKCKNKKPL